MSGGPTRDFLTSHAVNLLIAAISPQYASGGPWAIEEVQRPNRAEAVVTFVVGTHPADITPGEPDHRPRVRFAIDVMQP